MLASGTHRRTAAASGSTAGTREHAEGLAGARAPTSIESARSRSGDGAASPSAPGRGGTRPESDRCVPGSTDADIGNRSSPWPLLLSFGSAFAAPNRDRGEIYARLPKNWIAKAEQSFHARFFAGRGLNLGSISVRLRP